MKRLIGIYNRLILQFLILMVIPQALHAQLPKEPEAVLSPNAASLGTYGNLPVSLYTGTPVINIPLYEMISFGYKLPISLSYNASGVRPDQRPGWVGLGWSLNAGGVITRAVKDMPDEYNNSNYYLGSEAGYYYTHNILNNNILNSNNSSLIRDYLRQVAQSNNSIKDTEPDEFSFSFPGYNGKFYLDHLGQWQVQCDKPVKVFFNNTFLNIPFPKKGTSAKIYGYSPSFSGFTITTEEGIQYIFGGDVTAIDYSIGFFEQFVEEWIATAWYLTKIILQNGQEITLTYERGDFISQMYLTIHHDIEVSTESSGGLFNVDPACSFSLHGSIDTYYEGKLIAPVYLNTIESTSETVTFKKNKSNELNYTQSIYDWKVLGVYGLPNTPALPMLEHLFLPFIKCCVDPEVATGGALYPACLKNMKWYKLIRMSVEGQEGLLKTFSFEYNNELTERLMLTSITETQKGYTLPPEEIPERFIPKPSYAKTFRFYYDNPESLPPYLSNKTDHWGFFNDTYANIPSSYFINKDYSGYYTDRNPNANSLKYGVLNKIVYPTGGYTEFEFEPHYYRKELNITRDTCKILGSNNLAGGLRIKQIADYASDNVKTGERSYFYVSDYLQNGTAAAISSGVLGGKTQYQFDYVVYAYKHGNLKKKIHAFSSISALPACYNAHGSHIGYSEVIEKREDNSFTRYLYTNYDQGQGFGSAGYFDEKALAIIQETRTPYEPYSSKAQDRGLLWLREEYNADGNKIKSTINVYEKNNDNYVRSMSAKYSNICTNTAVSYDEGAFYKLYTYGWRPLSTTTVIYDPDGQNPVTSSIDYTYTANGLLRSEEHNQSNGPGANLKTEYRYASDVGATAMTQKNMIGIPIETITYSDGRVTEVLLQPYRNENGKLFPDFQNFLAANTSINDYTAYTNGNMDSRLQRQFSFDVYDSYGNILQYTGRDGLPVAYVWGYNYQYPIAKIVGATFSAVKTALGHSSDVDNNLAYLQNYNDTQLNTAFSLLRDNLPDALITTYTYKPSIGVSSVTSPANFTIYYEYDSLGRIQTAKDHLGNILQHHEYKYGGQEQ